MQKNKNGKQEIKQKFRRYGLKQASTKTYTTSLYRFCKEANMTHEDLLTRPLEEIEDAMETFIKDNENILSPKYLNAIYCSVKAFLHMEKRIKGKRNFREIKFDKSSNVENGLLAKALENKDVKKMFSMGDAKKKIVLSFAGLSALRPSLIPYLRVKHIIEKHRTLKNGKLALARPCLIIVPHIETDKDGAPKRDDLGRMIRVTGNKANIPFPAFIPSVISELLENALNRNTVTLETPLTDCRNKRQVRHVIKTSYKEIGYTGRPYDMRNFGAVLLDRLTLIFNDRDLKEFMLGHKPRIGNGLYTFRGLTSQKLADWIEKYTEAVEKYINEAIFGIAPQQGHITTALTNMAQDLGVEEEMLKRIREAIRKGDTSVEIIKTRIRNAIQVTQETRIRDMFDKWIQERETK